MSEPNDKPLSAPQETEATKAAGDTKNPPSEKNGSENADPVGRDEKDPDDEAAVVEPPDPGFGAPAD